MNNKGDILLVLLVIAGLTALVIYFYPKIGGYFDSTNSSNGSISINGTANQSITNIITTNQSDTNISVNNSSQQSNATANYTNQSGTNNSLQLPDLIVDSFNYSSTFLHNDSAGIKHYNLEVTLIIRNNGTSPAGNSTTMVDLNSLRRNLNTLEVSSGGTTNIVSSYENITAGSYTASAMLDWNYVISESKENNNGAIKEFTLRG